MDCMVTALWKRVIDPERTFIIAEAGVNHNGSSDMAKQLVDAAARAGSDAVKFQTFNARRLASIQAPKAQYQLQTTDARESQVEMLARLELTRESHRELQEYCRRQDIVFLSSPFDESSADFLENLGVELFKIPSGEITNIPFLSHIARKGLPLILSTGMATLSEVETAVRTFEKEENRNIVLLHCVSNYPARPSDVNLRAMITMNETFHIPVGYSDHTEGIEIAIAAVALGARVIEKHFTLDHNLPGPDHRASLEPNELKTLVQSIRMVEVSLGTGRKEPAPGEAETARVARKSLVAARDIPAGTILTEDYVAIKRPGTGLPPSLYPYIVGRTLRYAIPEGTLISLEMLT
jgi:N,N'-diacetyllegionaminate synthase